MNDTSTLVDIVLLNYRGWRDTIDCLESVMRLAYDRYRVIVCDNGSADDSLARIRRWADGERMGDDRVGDALRGLVEPPVPKPIPHALLSRAEAEAGAPAGERLIFVDNGANLGFAAGNNVAIRWSLARGEAKYVLLLNNDTVIGSEALSFLVGCAESDAKTGAVGATILDFAMPDRMQEAAGGRFSRYHGMVRMNDRGAARGSPHVGRLELEYVSGACLLARVDAIRQIGLLDEGFFMYGEDEDFGLRLRKGGWHLKYCSRAEVWHRGGGTAGHGSPAFDYHTVRSTLRLVRKHHPAFVPAAVLYSLYRCVAPKVVRGQWARLGATMRAYRDFARGAPAAGRSPS